MDLVHAMFSDSWVRESGAVLYGPNTAKWPARYFDAVVIAEQERARADRELDRVRAQMK